MKRTLLSLSVAILTFTPALASSYTFDDMCAPETQHNAVSNVPNIMFSLDQSGSMTRSCCGGSTRWVTAVTVIDEVIRDLTNDLGPDEIHAGLGYFDSGRTIAEDAREDSYQDISDSLATEMPNSGTQTGQMVRVIDDSTSLDNPNKVNVGIGITDGIPDGAPTTIDAVNVLCRLRDRTSAPIATYIVGFGSSVQSGRGLAINNFLAAAGGTGECCAGETYPCASTFAVDPCKMDATTLGAAILDTGEDDSTYISEDYTCGGALSAEDGDALKNQLKAIVDGIACTYPLDIPVDYPGGTASDNTDATNVDFNHVVFGSIKLPYCPTGTTDCGMDVTIRAITGSDASEYKDEGWEWANPGRTAIKLSDKLCEDINAKEATSVDTQVACLCRFEGQGCTYTEVDADGDGNVDTLTAEQLANMPCAVGIYVCPDGSTDICEPVADKRPEICNGVDDNCDGLTDNMDSTEDDPDFQSVGFEIPATKQGIDCNGQNVCGCPNGARDPISVGNLQDYWNSWTGACICGEGLGPDEASLMSIDDTPSAPEAETDSGAACSVQENNHVGSSLIFALFVLGMLGFRRRRVL